VTNNVESYGWDTTDGPDSCGYIAPVILRILRDLNIKRVCDLGSGNGVLANQIKQAGYYVAGVEKDEQGVTVSKKTYPGINFYQFGVEDDVQDLIKHEKQGFDVVVSTEVIEHLYSPHLLPIFAHKILVTRGYLIISTPYHGYLKNVAISLFNKWDHHHTALWHGGHIKFWSQATLTSLLESHGFKLVGFYGAGRLPWLWKSMILVAQRI